MAYTEEDNAIVIDGFEKGIAQSPYLGIANIRNLNTTYYPSVAYTNYRRQAATLNATTEWYAGSHSTNVSNNSGWIFTSAPSGPVMTNPVSKAISPVGLIYIQDDSGEIWKQSTVNSSTFNLLEGGAGRITNGNAGIAFWQNYLVVFGGGVIEFCGDGTGDAGIISANWNQNGLGVFGTNTSTFTTNFGSVATIIALTTAFTALPKFNVGDSVTFITTGTLPAGLSLNTTYYIATMSNNVNIRVSTSFANSRTYLTGSISTATSATLATNWTQASGTYSMAFSDGSVRSVTLTNGANTVTWSGTVTASALTSVVITLTSDGSGTHTITDTTAVIPLGNYTNLQSISFSGSLPYANGTLDSLSGIFGSYIDPLGNAITGIWEGATGLYNIVMNNNSKIPANFVNGSSTVTFLSPISNYTTGVWSIQLIDTTVTNYKPYVSKVDGSLYFANGQFLGRIAITSNPNLTFNPTLPSTYSVSVGVTALPEEFIDTIIDMVDLKNNLIIAGKKDVYVWDYLSASTSSPSPVGEPIVAITNLLNNIYILAGQKGDIYISNGYSAQLLTKIPDYIAGVIDPVWLWGGLMTHRSRLYFQALAQNTSGTNLLAGIFSLMVSPSMLGEQASGLVQESQNSYGLIPAAGALQNGLLIDVSPSSSGQDAYYSAWSNGASIGGIDYNDTTLWQNYEPTIETDIIPIGTILEKKTLGNIEFKLDRPMVTGDFIKLYWRPSLSDSYILMGTTSTNQLSEYFTSNISQSQWAQFKATFKCASSGSSFIPFREIRISIS